MMRLTDCAKIFLCGLGFLLLTCVQAQGISYTVQAIALSDQGAALKLQQQLVAEGYPVYLVSTPTDSGVISRLRIGAFANRAAAVRFAEELGNVAGSLPVPALAEGIPPGLIPLEPKLITTYPYFPDVTSLHIIPWGEGYALRFQGSFEAEPLEASYRILSPELVQLEFDAWRAAPRPDGAIDRVYNFRLWPRDLSGEDEASLEAYGANLLATVAGTLELSPEQVRPYRFNKPGSGIPYLVLAERFDPVSGESTRYRALGNPRSRQDDSGPSLTWFGRAEPEDFPSAIPESVIDLAALLGNLSDVTLPDPEELSLQGDGWTATPDGAYTRLTLTEDQGRSWLSVAGYPLWAHGDFLLVYHQDELVLYQFIERRP